MSAQGAASPAGHFSFHPQGVLGQFYQRPAAATWQSRQSSGIAVAATVSALSLHHGSCHGCTCRMTPRTPRARLEARPSLRRARASRRGFGCGCGLRPPPAPPAPLALARDRRRDAGRAARGDATKARVYRPAVPGSFKSNG